MLSTLKNLIRSSYHPLNTFEISAYHLKHNYKYLSYLNSRLSIAPVLKSNAYGHGIVEVASILDPLNPPFFCVDSIYEAYQLLKAKIKTPILVMGYIHPDTLKVKKLPFSFAIYSIEMLEALHKYQE